MASKPVITTMESKPVRDRVCLLSSSFIFSECGSGPLLSAPYWKINLSGLGARLENEVHFTVWGSAPQSSAS